MGWLALGILIGAAGLRGWQIWNARHRIAAAMKKIDNTATAVEALRKIARVAKVEHAHKIANRAIAEIES